MGEIGRSPGLQPGASPATRTGFYLHVTQLHAQIQLAVSLSPVDVRRQHLILHGHTAQGAGRRIAAPRCLGECATGAGRSQATNPRALERGQPATSRRPTLAGCACAMKIRGRGRRVLLASAQSGRGRSRAEVGRVGDARA